jgi:hypothetical protein
VAQLVKLIGVPPSGSRPRLLGPNTGRMFFGSMRSFRPLPEAAVAQFDHSVDPSCSRQLAASGVGYEVGRRSTP